MFGSMKFKERQEFEEQLIKVIGGEIYDKAQEDIMYPDDYYDGDGSLQEYLDESTWGHVENCEEDFIGRLEGAIQAIVDDMSESVASEMNRFIEDNYPLEEAENRS